MNENIYDGLSEDMKTIYNKYCLQDNLQNLTIDSVILSEDNKKQVDYLLTETKYKMKFVKHGLEPINRVLNYGASGTGKTFLTKCLAAHLNYELLAIDIAGALSTGNAANALEDVFKLGNYLGKAIIFLDECDAIARDRSDKSVPEDPNIRRANNALFQLLDRMNPECLFISATNLYEELDPAFIRRFNLKLRFDRPKLDSIDETINKFLLKDFILIKDMEPDTKNIIIDYAQNYTGLSYDEIQTWVERAEKKAIINDTLNISEKDIYGYFLDSLRIKISFDEKRNKFYLYKCV